MGLAMSSTSCIKQQAAQPETVKIKTGRIRPDLKPYKVASLGDGLSLYNENIQIEYEDDEVDFDEVKREFKYIESLNSETAKKEVEGCNHLPMIEAMVREANSQCQHALEGGNLNTLIYCAQIQQNMGRIFANCVDKVYQKYHK